MPVWEIGRASIPALIIGGSATFRKAKVQPWIQTNFDAIHMVLLCRCSVFHLPTKTPAAPSSPFSFLIKEVCSSSAHVSCHAGRPPERQPGTLPVLRHSRHKSIQNTKIHAPVQLSVPAQLACVKGEPPLLWKPASGPPYSILQLSADPYGGLSCIQQ